MADASAEIRKVGSQENATADFITMIRDLKLVDNFGLDHTRLGNVTRYFFG